MSPQHDKDKNDSAGDTRRMRSPLRTTQELRTLTPTELELRRAQVLADLTSIDRAIELLTGAASSVRHLLGSGHDAFHAIELANEKARVARAKLELVRRRMP